MSHNTLPAKQGLYDPRNEHDACGVGFIAHIKGRKNHQIIQQGLELLKNLTHRGAVGADPLAGDGAGILIQIPDEFLRASCEPLNITLPPVGEYGVGMVFLPQDSAHRESCRKILEDFINAEGQTVLGWRDVPVDNTGLGESVKLAEPLIKQVFIGRGANCQNQDSFERKLFVIRKQAENTVQQLGEEHCKAFYLPSCSSRTLVYKGMLLADQVGLFYRDLQDSRMISALALVHQRFSTNTFPTWDLAHPFRMIAHNGEINTVRGNVNWMAARRSSMTSALLGTDLDKVWPLINAEQSDSACFDNALELLVTGGYSLVHAMMLLIPEAWAGNPMMDEKRRAFYEYHSALMEPWDGPAAVAFTDGRQIGATLDRNGLRPARYLITDDDHVVMASEMGVLPIPQHKIIKKWRLQPGKMFLIDLEKGQIVDDDTIKNELAGRAPYQQWVDAAQIRLENLPHEVSAMAPDAQTLLDRQQAFGYTQEDIKFCLQPMAETGMEPIGSMGIDAALAVLSNRSRLLYDYFKQGFAQVTNPAIDPIREELVMSLVSHIGPRPNLLGLADGGSHKRLEVHQPILSNEDLEKIRRIEARTEGAFQTKTISFCYAADLGANGMEQALAQLCASAEKAVHSGNNILVLSDRAVDVDHIGIPALLATSAVHIHLIRAGLRTKVGLVIETGEAREVHHFALLAGYGAEAVNPYLAFDTLSSLREYLPGRPSAYEVHKQYIKAIDKALLKVMSKMGISTYQSYCGAQIFNAVGLSEAFLDNYFTGTGTTTGGAGIQEIAEETVRRHRAAFGNAPLYRKALDAGGEYAYRVRGEDHIWTPETITKLQHATRTNNASTYAEYACLINEQNEHLLTLRGLMEFQFAKTTPVPLDEVEPAKEIVKRFATGAMSFGSISWEAHTTLAIAMNRIGGKSNTGEGGELPERFLPLANGDSMRSAIKQVASGRFGVTAEYLVNADDIQIKISQGAKPGEGGQLPGHKVDATIAKVRHSTPGVGLISPPPHHDIYSIEDLAQLIHDLKNVNPKARISVKLVSEVGVGTVAAGVAKAHADHVTISGYDGGTGASPITSIKHAGLPWEIGLAETHQTLVLNKLRGRICVQADGGIRTGRDVAIALLLGADEVGFATAPLIVEGCIMMRKCHLNTCPVGVATQDPELRKRFTGQPEHVVNFFFFVAEELRQLMAQLGCRTVSEMIGRSDLLDMRRAISHWKASKIDLSRILHKPEAAPGIAIRNVEQQDHGLDKALDLQLIAQAQPALEKAQPVRIETEIHNYNRTFGAMLSGEVAKRHGHKGLPEDTIAIKVRGTAGQSFGAFLAAGVSVELRGEGNDYVGKGLSGGRIAIFPPEDCPIKAEENIIAGNTALYGAISGECYLRGVAGERFAVRNSGAIAVVEGVGDHGCEYMTGGCVVVLGHTGRNFAAGMSGGVAYVLDESADFDKRCNLAMVELETLAQATDGNLATAEGNLAETQDLEELMRNMSGNDTQRLRALIQRHYHYTGSERAKTILDSWSSYAPHFRKVMPVDYKKALLNARSAAVSQNSTAQH
ncbi:glutamate synthase large subunit [Candidatus Methylospira mobilis]|uniref:Glutamate synthase [NADPH] large chain n=1 Tax=Candidatus Methylospira mobilis TaxID=1808979 RepID=A0A5Q0BI76_9GAMM|nr:glutamate synthase large subunit [Candidatus Methylospira mobilis]QFY42822.1 glutamate synthase large subunit [Candidatus Methylospira mobilis]